MTSPVHNHHPDTGDVSATPMPEAAFARTGIGLRAPHYDDILARRPDVGFLETHSENHFGIGGAPLHYLDRFAETYPISFHCIGLSLGSADGISRPHLARFKELVARYNPALISDHLSWSGFGGAYTPDLLPMPLTGEALDVLARNIDIAQNELGRRLLIENPSGYLAFTASDMDEPEFIAELATRTGCGLLLDLNNIYVSATNNGFDAGDYLHRIPTGIVGQMHLAGYQVNQADGQDILIDAHNSPVYDPVWALYEQALERFGDITTLIEWDNDLPALDVLLAEAEKADTRRNAARKMREDAA